MEQIGGGGGSGGESGDNSPSHQQQEQPTRDRQKGDAGGGGGGSGHHHHQQAHHHHHHTTVGHSSRLPTNVRPLPDYPLRILVQSDMIGAIIGRSGGTIREITQETRAKVDVHRKDSAGSSEKVISIYGDPENCSRACKRIMEVMQKEAINTNKGEIPLKILAHNNLIGRLIGKHGSFIKRVMETTNTKIMVSTFLHDFDSWTLERVICIRGTIDDMYSAERMISGKLLQSYLDDMVPLAPPAFVFPGLHPMAFMSAFNPYLAATGAPQPHAPRPLPTQLTATGSGATAGPPVQTTAAANASGSVGSGGAGPQGATAGGSLPVANVTGAGPLHSMYGAMYAGNPYLPSMMPYPTGSPVGGSLPPHLNAAAAAAAAGFGPPIVPPMMVQHEQIKETVFLYIPNTAVGAIIGAGGSTVREMMNSSGANIKVDQPPKEDPQQQSSSSTAASSPVGSGGGIAATTTSSEQQTTSEQSSPTQSQSPQQPTPIVTAQQSTERKVTIIGNPDAQMKAQSLIFRKVSHDLYLGIPDAVLRVEIFVPHSQVGRIIGKGGNTVRALQRNTYASIKLPEEGQTAGAEEIPVHISGTFPCTWAAQRQIRALVARSVQASSSPSRSRLKVTQQPQVKSATELPSAPGEADIVGSEVDSPVTVSEIDNPSESDKNITDNDKTSSSEATREDLPTDSAAANE